MDGELVGEDQGRVNLGSSGGDRVLGILLMILFGLSCALATFLGVMLVFVSDSCNDASCDTGLIVAGMVVTGVTPWVFFVASLVWLIVRSVRKRRIWWVPLVGLLASVIAAGVGIAMAFSGAPSGF